MRVIRMQVMNFSSFEHTGWIQFSPGINLIVGQNNAGKSALLRSLTRLQDNRHRAQNEWRLERLEIPRIELDLEISGAELQDAIFNTGGAIQWQVADGAQSAIDRFKQCLSEPTLVIRLLKSANTGFTLLSSSCFGQPDEQPKSTMIITQQSGLISIRLASLQPDTFGSIFDRLWSMKVFWFNAQRSGAGVSKVQARTCLNQTQQTFQQYFSACRASGAPCFSG